MTPYAAVDMIAQRTANMTEQGTAHTAEAPATRKVVGAWPSFSWLVVPFRHVTPVLRVLASPSRMVSVLSFVSASLRLHLTTAPLPLLFSWHGSRPDGRSSGLSVWHRVGGSTRGASCTPSPSDTFLGRFHDQHFRVRAATFWLSLIHI